MKVSERCVLESVRVEMILSRVYDFGGRLGWLIQRNRRRSLPSSLVVDFIPAQRWREGGGARASEAESSIWSQTLPHSLTSNALLLID